MAVPEQMPFKEYTANGITTVFPLGFDCDRIDFLIVTIDGNEAPVGSWSLLSNTVTFLVAPANGKIIALQRNTAFERATDYQSYDNSFRPAPVNKDFDLIWWKLQELGYTDWVLSNGLKKEILDRIAADEAIMAHLKSEDDALRADYIYRDNALKDDYIARDSVLRKYIDALVNNITGENFLPIPDRYVDTWNGRTQEDKNKDTIHVLDFKNNSGSVVSDQVAIQAAVNYCFLNNKILDWENAHLVSTGNITDFWKVTHTGQGTITKSDSVFNITPALTQVNNLYVSGTGLSTNDGLSSSTPVLKIQDAIDNLELYKNTLTGIYRVNITAGTYARLRFYKFLKCKVEFVGADIGTYPGVPTTLIYEGDSIAGFGAVLLCEVEMTNIKIKGYNKTTSACGIIQSRFPLTTNNVHVDDCFFGISGAGAGSILTLRSGKITNCGYLLGKASGNPTRVGAGIRGMFHTKLELGIQNSGVRNLEITGCSYGARFQEYTTGHVDWCNFHTNEIGIRQYTGSRVNASGTLFQNNTRAYWLSENSIMNTSAETEFSGNLNQSIVGEGCSDSFISTSNVSLGFNQKFIRMMIVPVVVTTQSTVRVIDFLGLKANGFTGVIQSGAFYKKLLVKVYGSTTGTAGTKTVALRLETTTDGLLNVNVSGNFIVEFEAVFFPNNGGVLMSNKLFSGSGVSMQTFKRVQSMLLDIDANINAYVENASDSLTITAIEWSMVGI